MRIDSNRSSSGNPAWVGGCAIACAVLAVAAFAQAGPPLLQLDHLNRLSSQAKNVVDVTIDSTTLQQTLGFLSGNNAKDEATKALIAGLKGVYVRSYEFDKGGAYTDKDVELIRAQLKTPWSRIVNVHERDSGETVEIYTWPQNDQTGGLAILVAEPKELTIVNIVGRINLSQLASLKGIPGLSQPLGAVPGAGGSKP